MIQKSFFMQKLVTLVTLLSFAGGPMGGAAFADSSSSSGDAAAQNKSVVDGTIKGYLQGAAAGAKAIKDLEKEYKDLCENIPRQQYIIDNKKVLGEQQSNAQCDGIKQTLKAAKAQDALWKVWGATAAVCLSTCMMSVIPSKDSIANKLNDTQNLKSPEGMNPPIKPDQKMQFVFQNLNGPVTPSTATNPLSLNIAGLGSCPAPGPDAKSILDANKGKLRKASLYYPEICASMNAAASIADGVATKQLMSALMGLATSGLTMAMNSQLLSKGPKFVGAKTAETCTAKLGGDKEFDFKKHEDMINRDYGSCLVGVQALMQMGMKIKGANDNKNNAKNSLTAVAQQLSVDKANQTQQANLYSGLSTNNQNTTAGATSTNLAANTAKSATAANTSNSDPCASSTGSNSVISCAVASDHTLPYLLRGEKFKKTLENVTGMGADQFFNKLTPQNASSIIASAATGEIASGSELTPGFEKTADKGMQLGMAETDANSTYRSGVARAHAPAESSSDPDLGNLINGVMSKLGQDGEKPEKEDDKNPELVFEKQKAFDRQLASDDNQTKGYDIFKRISRRYRLVDWQ